MRFLLGISALALVGALGLHTHDNPRGTTVPVGEQTLPPPGWTDFCNRLPKDCKPSPGLPGFTVTPERWQEVLAVNRGVNHLVWPATDISHYGVVEYWAYPDDNFGDCEDYVLLKRRMLLQSGWPSSRLLITIVFDQDITGHAVLTVRADGNDFILDSETDDLLLWKDTSFFRYKKRQSESDPDMWVNLEDGWSMRLLARR